MDIVSLVASVVQYISDGLWLSYDFDERNEYRKQRLRYIALVGAVALGLGVIAYDTLNLVFKALNTPMIALGLHATSALPVLGIISTSILCIFSFVRMRQILRSSDLSAEEQRKTIMLEGIRLVLSLLAVAILIAMLSFPPTGIALIATLMAVSILGAGFSAYNSYKKYQLSLRPPSIDYKALHQPTPSTKPVPHHTQDNSLLAQGSVITARSSADKSMSEQKNLLTESDPNHLIPTTSREESSAPADLQSTNIDAKGRA